MYVDMRVCSEMLFVMIQVIYIRRLAVPASPAFPPVSSPGMAVELRLRTLRQSEHESPYKIPKSIDKCCRGGSIGLLNI